MAVYSPGNPRVLERLYVLRNLADDEFEEIL